MPPTGFEAAIPAREPPQTYALDRAASGIGDYKLKNKKSQTLLLQGVGTPYKTAQFNNADCKLNFHRPKT
jgi:hypothetical protein